MARIRTVKPELLRHEDLFEAELESGLPLRIAFVGMFTVCDREGRFKWKPRQLKLDVLPYDDVEFSRVLDALESRGFIEKYEVKGKQYGVIRSFTAHQVINNKEKASDLPEPPATPVKTGDSTREPRVDDANETPLNPESGEGKGREKEGNKEKEGEGKGGADADAPTPPAEKPDEDKSRFKYSDDQYTLADRMTNPVRNRFPNQKINVDEWADAVRKLNELDNHSLADITALWAWVVRHETDKFSWADNCRTPMKLREKKDGLPYFDVIWKQMIRDQQGKAPSQKERDAEAWVSGGTVLNFSGEMIEGEVVNG